MMELEKMIQNPHDAERVRFLEGKDLIPADAQLKLEEVTFFSCTIPVSDLYGGTVARAPLFCRKKYFFSMYKCKSRLF